MLLFKRIVVVCLALILSIAPARAVLAPESIPAVFDELLKNLSIQFFSFWPENLVPQEVARETIRARQS